MNTIFLRDIERELEMAAEVLEIDPSAEPEWATPKGWRYWDVWLTRGGGWQLLYKLGPLFAAEICDGFLHGRGASCDLHGAHLFLPIAT
jgi:hypothetical protein